jgi:cyanophycinase
MFCAAGGKGNARFGVISAASENPCCDEDSSWAYYESQLLKYGAAEVYYIPITVDSVGNNSNPDVVAHIKTLTGFFFGGGDQTRIIASFYNNDERIPSPALIAIKETLLRTGGVVAGTSAGTDVQTINTMITGGASFEGLLNVTQTYWENVELPNENVLTAYGPGGIGLFPYGLLDTHFANRGRFGRFVALAVDTAAQPLGNHFAFGVDENTAMVVTGPWGRRMGSVIGERGVFLADTSLADSFPSESNSGRSVLNVRASRLSAGDEIDLQSMRISFAPYKVSMASREKNFVPETSVDIFGEYVFEWDKVIQSLFSSTHASSYGLTKQNKPTGFKVTFSKNPSADLEEECKGAGFDGVDPTTGLYAYGYSCLWLDMAPVHDQ